MSTRIRYVSERTDTNYSLVSQRVFSNGTAEFNVFLYPADGKFAIKNAATGELEVSGTGVSESNLKKKAKRALLALGVNFDAEVRNKTLANAS